MTMDSVENLFITEERQILNDTIVTGMSKKEILDDLALQYEANDSEEDTLSGYRDLLKSVSDKIESLSEEQVNYLITLVPLEVAYLYETNVDEVPEDEVE